MCGGVYYISGDEGWEESNMVDGECLCLWRTPSCSPFTHRYIGHIRILLLNLTPHVLSLFSGQDIVHIFHLHVNFHNNYYKKLELYMLKCFYINLSMLTKKKRERRRKAFVPNPGFKYTSPRLSIKVNIRDKAVTFNGPVRTS